jgi:hypothetical protein
MDARRLARRRSATMRYSWVGRESRPLVLDAVHRELPQTGVVNVFPAALVKGKITGCYP